MRLAALLLDVKGASTRVYAALTFALPLMDDIITLFPVAAHRCILQSRAKALLSPVALQRLGSGQRWSPMHPHSAHNLLHHVRSESWTYLRTVLPCPDSVATTVYWMSHLFLDHRIDSTSRPDCVSPALRRMANMTWSDVHYLTARFLCWADLVPEHADVDYPPTNWQRISNIPLLFCSTRRFPRFLAWLRGTFGQETEAVVGVCERHWAARY